MAGAARFGVDGHGLARKGIKGRNGAVRMGSDGKLKAWIGRLRNGKARQAWGKYDKYG